MFETSKLHESPWEFRCTEDFVCLRCLIKAEILNKNNPNPQCSYQQNRTAEHHRAHKSILALQILCQRIRTKALQGQTAFCSSCDVKSRMLLKHGTAMQGILATPEQCLHSLHLSETLSPQLTFLSLCHSFIIVCTVMVEFSRKK